MLRWTRMGELCGDLFNDAHRFCTVLTQLSVKPDAVSIIVLGNSIIKGIEVKTDYFFGRIGKLAGSTFEDNHLLRNKRTGNSIIQSSVRVGKKRRRKRFCTSPV